MNSNLFCSQVKILGLQYKKKYASPDDLKTLRYGKLCIMTDADADGAVPHVALAGAVTSADVMISKTIMTRLRRTLFIVTLLANKN